jgi:DNA modification methylase
MKNIHPFPARMAPELALTKLENLPANSIVLDPMAGSGTVLRQAVLNGHDALGFDIDPLARLMAQVWTTAVSAPAVLKLTEDVMKRAWRIKSGHRALPWIDKCKETQAFVDFWFSEPQQDDLRRLACVLAEERATKKQKLLLNVLQLAISRLIITKTRGASLAWDVSHSRPHRKRTENDFNVRVEFPKAVDLILKRLAEQPILGKAKIELGDARFLDKVANQSVDVVLTSPPYLNAIDYMRGHRLALVWLGYSLPALRQIRSCSVGTERGGMPTGLDEQKWQQLIKACKMPAELPTRTEAMVSRYIGDAFFLMTSIQRVLKPNGQAILVVGDSCLQGVPIANASYFVAAGKAVGLKLVSRKERPLPGGSRYLPVPKDSNNALARRMTTETVLSFSAAG